MKHQLINGILETFKQTDRTSAKNRKPVGSSKGNTNIFLVKFPKFSEYSFIIFQRSFRIVFTLIKILRVSYDF